MVGHGDEYVVLHHAELPRALDQRLVVRAVTRRLLAVAQHLAPGEGQRHPVAIVDARKGRAATGGEPLHGTTDARIIARLNVPLVPHARELQL
jgi:hypothetical protein